MRLLLSVHCLLISQSSYVLPYRNPHRREAIPLSRHLEKIMSKTKKAKMVSVSWVETKSYYAKYICPSCHTEYHGGGVNKSTLRFRCECGQELIVENTLPAVRRANKAWTGQLAVHGQVFLWIGARRNEESGIYWNCITVVRCFVKGKQNGLYLWCS